MIFARCLVRYGAAWLRLWEGVDIEAIKADWERVLERTPRAAIEHGLDNLPADRPPNATQFHAICQRAPQRPAKLLPAPAADRARVAELVAGVCRPASGDPLVWARKLHERQQAGERLSVAQRDALAALYRRGVTFDQEAADAQ